MEQSRSGGNSRVEVVKQSDHGFRLVSGRRVVKRPPWPACSFRPFDCGLPKNARRFEERQRNWAALRYRVTFGANPHHRQPLDRPGGNRRVAPRQRKTQTPLCDMLNEFVGAINGHHEHRQMCATETRRRA